MTGAQIAQERTEPVILKTPGSVLETDANLGFRSRRWSFTLNNYTTEETAHIAQYFEHCWCVGMEVGEEGTPHLQGYVEIPNPKALTSLKRIVGERAHLEPAYKHRTANLQYCRKGGNMLRDDFPTLKKYCGEDLPKKEDLFDWQLTILKILDEKPNNREVYWFYEDTGNTGKSMFGKYLCYHKKNVCLLTCTKSADILTAVDEQYDTYILDFPRTLGVDYCPYTAIEQLKNGFITDAKLKKKARIMMFDPPHVIIFSNHKPELSKLSRDRWRVYNIHTGIWEE